MIHNSIKIPAMKHNEDNFMVGVHHNMRNYIKGSQPTPQQTQHSHTKKCTLQKERLINLGLVLLWITGLLDYFLSMFSSTSLTISPLCPGFEIMVISQRTLGVCASYMGLQPGMPFSLTLWMKCNLPYKIQHLLYISRPWPLIPRRICVSLPVYV